MIARKRIRSTRCLPCRCPHQYDADLSNETAITTLTRQSVQKKKSLELYPRSEFTDCRPMQEKCLLGGVTMATVNSHPHDPFAVSINGSANSEQILYIFLLLSSILKSFASKRFFAIVNLQSLSSRVCSTRTSI